VGIPAIYPKIEPLIWYYIALRSGAILKDVYIDRTLVIKIIAFKSTIRKCLKCYRFLLAVYSRLRHKDSPHTVPKAMDDFMFNNEKKKHSSYGTKSFIL
jgi:hypothetical protein